MNATSIPDLIYLLTAYQSEGRNWLGLPMMLCDKSSQGFGCPVLNGLTDVDYTNLGDLC